MLGRGEAAGVDPLKPLPWISQPVGANRRLSSGDPREWSAAVWDAQAHLEKAPEPSVAGRPSRRGWRGRRGWVYGEIEASKGS